MKTYDISYLAFFDDIEKIIVFDDLSKFLGVNDNGLVELSYLDIVKTAGHSCATVAGAYLSALKGLKVLYGDQLPQRGQIKVELQKAPTEDNAGVVGCVLSNITGATTDFGFGGIPTGEYNRRQLLFFKANIDCDVLFTRLDTGQSIGINYLPQKVAQPMMILKSAIMPGATQEDIDSFPKRFQHMVKNIFDNADKVIEIVKK